MTRIKSSITQALGIAPSDERRLRTAVYGGKVNTATHRLYKFEIESLDGKVIEAYDEKVLCGADLLRVPKGPWITELHKKGISFNDFVSCSNNIDLIIGSQHLHPMITGHCMETSYSYMAIETLFGWTLNGKLKDTDNRDQNMSMLVFSLFASEADITQLWKLETIGIRDPLE